MLLLTYVPATKILPVFEVPVCGYSGYSDCDALYGGSICAPLYGAQFMFFFIGIKPCPWCGDTWCTTGKDGTCGY